MKVVCILNKKEGATAPFLLVGCVYEVVGISTDLNDIDYYAINTPNGPHTFPAAWFAAHDPEFHYNTVDDYLFNRYTEKEYLTKGEKFTISRTEFLNVLRRAFYAGRRRPH
jgi:hypothetical protein